MKYFATIMTIKVIGISISCESKPIFFEAQSKKEARKIALATAKSEWPKTDGWRNHQASVIEFPQEAE